MRAIKEINFKNQTYYIFYDMINIKDFDSNLLKKTKTHTKSLIIIILSVSIDYTNIHLKNLLDNTYHPLEKQI